MKVKLKLVAKNDVFDKDGVYVRTDDLKDALQVIGLDGRKIGVENFGKQLSNFLIAAQMPASIQDVIAYRRQIEKIYDNNGEPFEIDEAYISIIKEAVKQHWPVITYSAVVEYLDKSLIAAQNKENKPTKK